MRKYNQFILEKINEEIKLILEGQLHASSDFLRNSSELLRHYRQSRYGQLYDEQQST
jgi:hypothetical protein